MALTLRLWKCKTSLKITFPLNFDKNVLVRLQHELFSSQSVHLKQRSNVKEILNKPSGTYKEILKVNNPELVGLDKLRINNYVTSVLETKRHAVINSLHLNQDHLRISSQLKPNIKPETDNVADFTESQNDSNNRPDDRPSPDKLNHIFNVLSNNLPKLFIQSFDYNIYDSQIIFENNILGKRTVGLYPYIKQISFLRLLGHFKYAYVKLDVLKITQHPEDSTVKVRWSIHGISGWKVIVLFWKYRLWNIKELFEKTVPWYDGFSTFHVNGKGKIYKHVADKMMPDMDREEATSNRTSSIAAAAKLTLIIGVIPKCSDMNSFF